MVKARQANMYCTFPFQSSLLQQTVVHIRFSGNANINNRMGAVPIHFAVVALPLCE